MVPTPPPPLCYGIWKVREIGKGNGEGEGEGEDEGEGEEIKENTPFLS